MTCTHCDEPGYPRSWSFGVPLCDAHAETPADGAKQFSVLVDTTEIHTRRYTIEADSEDEAEQLVYDGAIREYTDDFEGLALVDDSFIIIEVTEIGT